MIPSQLVSDRPCFIKIASESKAPLKGNSASDGPFYVQEDRELIGHITEGGNVGRVLRDSLIAFDIDSEEFLQLVDEELGSSFTVESGGSGFGLHRYYSCPAWEGNHSQITVDSDDYGSLRSGNSYCLVPPSRHDKTAERYRIESEESVKSVSVSEVESLLKRVGKTANTTGGGGESGGGGGSVGSLRVPEEYPGKPAEWDTMRSWLDSNQFLHEFNRTSSSDWSGLEFKIAKCLAEGGFAEESITEALNRLSANSKWHSRGQRYRQRTVRKAVLAACNDNYVDFSTDDMGASKASESRKTESGSEETRLKGGENRMPEFTEKETVQVKEGSSDGDRAVEAVKVEGKDGSDTFEFVSIRKGRIETVKLTNGEEAQIVDIDDTNGKSVGGTADLELVIEALEDLNEKIN
jgi:hypothetical protein